MTNGKDNGMAVEPLRHLLPLSERNAETAALAIRELTTKVFECLEVVQLQQRTLTMMVQRVEMLEQLLNVQKMQLTGLGPSVKP